MNVHKLIAVAMAALLVTAGAAAAAPGDSPTNDGTETAEEHQPTETGDDATDADDDDASDADANATDGDAQAADAPDENASEAPPTELPEPVPDQVSEIHQLIRDKLNGDLGNTTLGEAISGVVGGDDEADSQADAAGEESENADEGSTQAQGQSSAENTGVAGDLPQQAADQVGAIHDAIMSFLDGNGDNPGDDVSSAAQ
ncbi:MAG: hypothetical protein GWN07_06200, partial [Actinobacteria bacterium]|nr:hypothetical protein [Actinomycetota bacterium]NIU65084.1 hypothetical protein [Actinomycetota bacterium]NIV86152.1 hypothetical protein [Actinomycetota bacterium]NIW26885.1 hypothetical protein [Actinomycetota bacterium]NIX19440.1 hypothetical protein [Actinomycetota bacterium]